ncbi:hypothetical protein CBM2599_B60070 [Cupriavidus taiwanensis]|nr:hypothetical protein CBM2600_B80070 [Cupriavidus taiwanensis]SOZ06700.1 hypothetical protein CBM2599_B60070 [Cupriavidus taiwanensis]
MPKMRTDPGAGACQNPLPFGCYGSEKPAATRPTLLSGSLHVDSPDRSLRRARLGQAHCQKAAFEARIDVVQVEAIR